MLRDLTPAILLEAEDNDMGKTTNCNVLVLLVEIYKHGVAKLGCVYDFADILVEDRLLRFDVVEEGEDIVRAKHDKVLRHLEEDRKPLAVR